MDRGQLPLSLLEVAVGVVLVLGLVATIALGVPTPDTNQAQLDTYAEDALTLLANEPPEHAGSTRLSEMVASQDRFERERGTVDRRIDRILPDNLLYRLETPHGTIGHPMPADVTEGRATATTPHGSVTLRVWYV